MTPETIVDQLLEAYETPEFAHLLEQLTSHLSIDVISILFDGVRQDYFPYPQRALKKAEISKHVVNIVATEEAFAQSCWMLGIANQALNNTEIALSFYRKVEPYYERIGDLVSVAGLQTNQCGLLNRMGQYEKAIALGKKAYDLIKNRTDDKAQRFLGALENQLGIAYRRQGKNQEALDAYLRARNVYSNLGSMANARAIDMNRAVVLREMQRFEEAHTLLMQARQSMVEANWVQEIARVDLNLGVLSYLRGHYQPALQFLGQAYSGFSNIPEPCDMAIVNLYRSYVYRDLNLIPETIQMAAQAGQTMRYHKRPWQHALALINEGVGYKRLGKMATAEAIYSRARRLLVRLGAKTVLQQLDMNRAELALQQNRITTAIRIARRLLKQINSEQLPALSARLHLLIVRGRMARSDFHYKQINEHIEQAQVLVEAFHLLGTRIELHYLLGVIAWRRKKLHDANRHLQTAVGLVNQWQNQLRWDEFRVGFMVDKLYIYKTAVAIMHNMVACGDAEIAQLLNVLSATYPQPTKTRLEVGSSSIQDEIYRLRQRWHWLQNQLEGVEQITSDKRLKTGSENRQIYKQLHEIEQKLAEHTRRMQTNEDLRFNNQEHDFTETPKQFLTKIQHRLQAHELVCHYYLADNNLHLVLITAREVMFLPDLVSAKTLEKLQRLWSFHIRYLANVLDSSSIFVAQRLLKDLYQYLITPLKPRKYGDGTLYLLVPPAFAGLPFPAFFDGQQYLANQFACTYIQSLHQLLAQETKELPASYNKALVVGYSDGQRLPWAVTEAKWVARTLTHLYSQTDLLLELDVTYEQVSAKAEDAELIHLSTHAFFRTDNPFFSWIRLADNRIIVNDLYQMRLEKQPFIFLSACETGRGQQRGGGSLGMSRALLAAGAGNLVVSQWPIADAHAKQIVADFYKHFIHNEGIAEALATAQRTAIQRREHPFFWAGYIHIHG